ncbi:UNVERIFIED_CONTAM: hypothetical protein H355_002468 [Colinus virginianus]|nr:hypothetical protein H355_002468 [Colinus virginianus]
MCLLSLLPRLQFLVRLYLFGAKPLLSQPRQKLGFTLLESVVSERDYESLVMMRMRQAAERQQLIAQLQREDEEESHS